MQFFCTPEILINKVEAFNVPFSINEYFCESKCGRNVGGSLQNDFQKYNWMNLNETWKMEIVESDSTIGWKELGNFFIKFCVLQNIAEVCQQVRRGEFSTLLHIFNQSSEWRSPIAGPLESSCCTVGTCRVFGEKSYELKISSRILFSL